MLTSFQETTAVVTRTRAPYFQFNLENPVNKTTRLHHKEDTREGITLHACEDICYTCEDITLHV